jgi:hypothetical protein
MAARGTVGTGKSESGDQIWLSGTYTGWMVITSSLIRDIWIRKLGGAKPTVAAPIGLENAALREFAGVQNARRGVYTDRKGEKSPFCA